MTDKNRKALSWTTSLAIHATLLFLLLFAGYHFAMPEGDVTAVTTVEVVESGRHNKPTQAPGAEPTIKEQISEDPEAEAPLEEKVAATDTSSEEQTQSDNKAEDKAQDNDQSDGTSQQAEIADATPSQDQAQNESQPQGNATSSLGNTLDESKLTELAGNRKPEYPWNARLRRQEGTVLLRAFINRDGAVTTPAIETSSGYKILDDEALKAYSSWRYQPGLTGWVIKPFKFSLK